MRVVTLEEHFTVPSLVTPHQPARPSPGAASGPGTCRRAASTRWTCCPRSARSGCASMDEAGITVQVLSTSGPGADLVDGAEGVALAREMNDALAEAIARHPDRFAGFAHLPMREPDAAAKELARAVRDARLLRRAHQRHDRGPLPRRSQVRAHPGGGGSARRADLHPPAPGARGRAQGLLRQSSVQFRRRAGGGRLGLALGDGASMCCAWCCPARSTAIPKLKLIIGHMGEGLPMMLARCRPGVRGLYPAPRAADQPDHPRPGLDHDQRHIQRAAVPRGAADVRHRPHPVLRRLSLRSQRARPAFLHRCRCRPPIWPSSPTATPIGCWG